MPRKIDIWSTILNSSLNKTSKINYYKEKNILLPIPKIPLFLINKLYTLNYKINPKSEFPMQIEEY